LEPMANTEDGQRPLRVLLEGSSGVKYRIEEVKYTIHPI
jgi:hypothetical protein